MTMFMHQFWPAYPKKADRQAAYRAWRKLRVGPDLLASILAGLEQWKRCPKWTKDGGQFQHHAATWLNKRLWEDEEVCGTPPRATPSSEWWRAAGFDNVHEARNAGCYEYNVQQFRDGQRLKEAA